MKKGHSAVYLIDLCVAVRVQVFFSFASAEKRAPFFYVIRDDVISVSSPSLHPSKMTKPCHFLNACRLLVRFSHAAASQDPQAATTTTTTTNKTARNNKNNSAENPRMRQKSHPNLNMTERKSQIVSWLKRVLKRWECCLYVWYYLVGLACD